MANQKRLQLKKGGIDDTPSILDIKKEQSSSEFQKSMAPKPYESPQSVEARSRTSALIVFMLAIRKAYVS